MKSHIRAGQFKLRGKKFALLTCKCCSVEDFRDKYRNKLAKQEALTLIHN